MAAESAFDLRVEGVSEVGCLRPFHQPFLPKQDDTASNSRARAALFLLRAFFSSKIFYPLATLMMACCDG